MPKDVSESAIIDAAVSTFVARGYVGATTREIAAAAGVNEVTLFRRFGTKKQLMVAAVGREVRAFREGWVRYTGDLKADLGGIVASYAKLVGSRGRLFVGILAESAREPELFEALAESMTAIDQVAELLARYQQEGLLRQEPVEDVIAALVGPVLARGVMSLVRHGRPPGPIDPAQVVRGFLAGHAGPAAGQGGPAAGEGEPAAEERGQPAVRQDGPAAEEGEPAAGISRAR